MHQFSKCFFCISACKDLLFGFKSIEHKSCNSKYRIWVFIDHIVNALCNPSVQDLLIDAKMIRWMLRLRPIPTASLATST